MPTFSNIDGEESATVTFTVAAVSLTRNSSAELQEILSIGDPDVASSLGVARVTASAPASTNAGLNVRILSGPSSVADFSVRAVLPSTYGDHALRVLQSTAADLNVTVAGYSTTVNVSSLSGPVIVRSSAADAIVTVKNSTIGELLASVQQNSTVWQTQAKIQDSSAVGFIGTTTRPTTGAQGLVVRGVLNDLLSTCFSTIGNNSTSSTIVSSVAGLRHKVYAFSITSTVQAVNSLSFRSSQASTIWQMQHQSVSSGISGITQAVTPPSWLFATAAADPLVFSVTGTTGTYHLSFSYFTEA